MAGKQQPPYLTTLDVHVLTLLKPLVEQGQVGIIIQKRAEIDTTLYGHAEAAFDHLITRVIEAFPADERDIFIDESDGQPAARFTQAQSMDDIGWLRVDGKKMAAKGISASDVQQKLAAITMPVDVKMEIAPPSSSQGSLLISFKQQKQESPGQKTIFF